LRALGRPICVGVSRKSFIGALTGQDNPVDRLPGSLAAAAAAVLAGAHIVRTHDVAETLQAVQVAAAIRRARGDVACR
jgi:dihydropteroate synthase